MIPKFSSLALAVIYVIFEATASENLGERLLFSCVLLLIPLGLIGYPEVPARLNGYDRGFRVEDR